MNEAQTKEFVEAVALARTSKKQAVARLSSLLDQVTLDPDRAELLGIRGSFNRELGNTDAAVADFVSALELVPVEECFNRFTLESSLGALFAETGRVEDAAQWLMRAIETSGGDPDISIGWPVLALLEILNFEELSRKDQLVIEDRLNRNCERFGIAPVQSDQIEEAATRVAAANRSRP